MKTETAFFKEKEIIKPLIDGREVVYLAGPMFGYEDFNEVAFRTAQAELEERGFHVIVPHDGENRPPEMDPLVKDERFRPLIQQYMRHDFIQILTEAHVVVVLPGWEESTGCRDEVRIAQVTGVPVIRFSDMRELAPKAVVTVPRHEPWEMEVPYAHS